MNTPFRKLFLVIAFLSISKILLAQKTSDAKFLFKTWLFLEHNNTKAREATQFTTKDSSLFNLFQSEIDFKFDTLKMKGFLNDYFFLAITANEDISANHDGIIYKKNRLIDFLDIPMGNCEAFILCVNKSKGTSYRLQGFYGNDFLSLFHEVQAGYLKETNKRLSIKLFLKSYSVEGLDFECLYRGLTSGENDFNKFPCLKNCSDITVIVH